MGDFPRISSQFRTRSIARSLSDSHVGGDELVPVYGPGSAYAYSTNVLLRDMGIRDTRTLTDVHEIAVPDVGASFENAAPAMKPFVVMEDERVKVTAILVPHGFLDHLLQSHVEVQKVGPIAQRAGVSKLVLTHISDLAGNPLDADKWKSWAQAGYDGEVVVGDDLQRIALA